MTVELGAQSRLARRVLVLLASAVLLLTACARPTATPPRRGTLTICGSTLLESAKDVRVVVAGEREQEQRRVFAHEGERVFVRLGRGCHGDSQLRVVPAGSLRVLGQAHSPEGGVLGAAFLVTTSTGPVVVSIDGRNGVAHGSITICIRADAPQTGPCA